MTAATPATPKVEKTAVTLTDGRIAEFGKKQRLIKNSTIADDGTISVQLDFVNGQTRNFVIPPAMIARFAAHGAEQKLGDVIAGENDISDAVLAMDDLIAQLLAGNWSVRREAGAFTGTSVLIQALVEASGKTVADIKAFLENKSQAEKLALRRSEKLRPIIERLEAEKAAKSGKTVNGDALLDELGLGASASDSEAPAKSKSKSSAAA